MLVVVSLLLVALAWVGVGCVLAYARCRIRQVAFQRDRALADRDRFHHLWLETARLVAGAAQQRRIEQLKAETRALFGPLGAVAAGKGAPA